MTLTLLNNRYQVLRVLGSGGFGETFLAEDTQMPSNRRCVIKQLKPIANNPQVYQLVQQRFQQEAAILEELGKDSNRRIPELYAYFVADDQFYLVQEYIEGHTLTQKLQQQGLLSESAVKEILINTLPLLEYVHNKGIVHRDIKPDNIILRLFDDKPVLIDFGAVKVTMATVMSNSGNSNQSIVIGTPGFMPMEQSVGRPVFSSDLYSLGLTAIYLLTGKLPQEFATDPATGDVLWRNYAGNVSYSFADVLDKAIQQSPRDRYFHAKDMLAALQALSTPITPTLPSPQPTLIATPATFPPYSPPLYQQAVPSTPVSSPNGSGTWQQAAIIGGVLGTFLVGGLWLFKGQVFHQQEPLKTEVQSTTSPISSESTLPTSDSQKKSTQAKQNNSDLTNIQTSETPTISNTTNIPSTNTSSESGSTITQEEAKNIINNWLQAKRVMFAPPYNPQPASELTIGDEYQKVAGVDGSINSLKNDGHYYKYGIQRIDAVDNFSVTGNQAIIQVQITEDRTLFDKNGNILPKETDFKTRTLRYTLQFVDARWKIANKQNLTD